MELITKTQNNTGEVNLSPIQIPEDYCKEWNVSGDDYMGLTRNGELISDSYYRHGGIGGFKPQNKYSLILKYVEDFYSKKIMDMSKSKSNKHLDGRWCIMTNTGIEKIVFDSHKMPYLIGGCIYKLDNNYYNIETNELYCNASNHISSEEFIFIENKWDKDKSRRGVWKINKNDGSHEIFN